MGANDTPTTTPASTVEQMNGKPLEVPVEGELLPSDVGGAPTKYTPKIVGKLIAAFNNAYNITEACQFAGIDRTTYYDWLESQPGFSNRMDEAKSMVMRRAKEIVVAAVDAGDSNLAFKLLQARDPDFKPKLGVSPEPGMEKAREKIKEFLDEPTNYDDPAGEPVAGESDVAGAEPTASAATDGSEAVAPATPDIS